MTQSLLRIKTTVNGIEGMQSVSGFNYWTEKEDDKILTLEHTPLSRGVIMFWTAGMGRVELVWLIDPSWKKGCIARTVTDKPLILHYCLISTIKVHMCMWIRGIIIYLWEFEKNISLSSQNDRKIVNYDVTFFKMYATVMYSRQDTAQAKFLFFKLI